MSSIEIIRLPENIDRWHLVKQYLALRKDIFVDQMEWPLHHDESIEFEQYDTLGTVYIIAHDDEVVTGGARLVRTDAKLGVYSYMIRDAFKKTLPGLPSNLCYDEPPVDNKVWELTRFASKGSLNIGSKILNACNEFLKRERATSCLFLGPPAFMRMAKSMGYKPEAMGAITGNQDGRFLAFSCNVI